MSGKVCRWCMAVLVQGEDERDQNFEKREYCDKVHAGLHRCEKRKEKER